MAHLPTIRQLQYFIALSETLHFGKASEKMFVSQSTFSTGISELESVLGGKLVERDNRHVRITDLGFKVLERARKLLSEAEAITAIADEGSQAFSNPFKLAVIPSILPFILTQVQQGIASHFPKAQFFLEERQSLDALRRLKNAEIDAIVMALPFNTGEFEVDALYSEPLYWVGNTQLAQELNISTHTHTGHLNLNKLLLLEEGHCLTGHTISACPQQQGQQMLNQHVKALSLMSLIELIHSGAGFGFLPKMAVDSLWLRHHPHITHIPLQKAPERTIALVYRKTHVKFEEVALIRHLLLSDVATTISEIKPTLK